jgi:amino acid transporter
MHLIFLAFICFFFFLLYKGPAAIMQVFWSIVFIVFWCSVIGGIGYLGSKVFEHHSKPTVASAPSAFRTNDPVLVPALPSPTPLWQTNRRFDEQKPAWIDVSQ